jgi:hypothetical protein
MKEYCCINCAKEGKGCYPWDPYCTCPVWPSKQAVPDELSDLKAKLAIAVSALKVLSEFEMEHDWRCTQKTAKDGSECTCETTLANKTLSKIGEI